MADTTFVDGSTVINAAWLNDVNDVVYNSDGANLVDFTPATSTGATVRSVQGKLRDFIHLKDFGAVGDGVTNDRVAIQNAIAHAKATGAGLYASPENTFYLGTTTGASEYYFTIDFDNFYFEPNNCKFTVTANLSFISYFMVFLNASNFYVGDCRIEANAVTTGSFGSLRGMYGLAIYNTNTNTKNGKFGVIQCLRLLAGLQVVTDNYTSYRHSGIVFDKIINKDGEYGCNFANNGDDVNGIIMADACVRSYFPYGVSGHNVVVYSKNHSMFNDVLIHCYNRATKNIKIRYFNENDSSTDVPIRILTETDSDGSTSITDIDIEFNVTLSNTALPAVTIEAYTLTGFTLRTTTACVFDNIRISGETNSNVPMQLNSELTGEQQGRLYVEKRLLRGLVDYKRFSVIDGHNTIVAMGAAANTMTMKLNLAPYKNYYVHGLMTVFAVNDTAFNTNYLNRVFWVTFLVQSDGVVSGISTSTISTFTADAGAFSPAITLTGGAAGTFNLSVAVTNYTGATRTCKLHFQPMTAIP